jgi:hypothetical protein
MKRNKNNPKTNKIHKKIKNQNLNQSKVQIYQNQKRDKDKNRNKDEDKNKNNDKENKEHQKRKKIVKKYHIQNKIKVYQKDQKSFNQTINIQADCNL